MSNCSAKTKFSVFPDGLLAVADEGAQTRQPLKISATPFKCRKPSEIPPRQWLEHYVRQFVSVTIAPSGVGKSSKSLVEAMAMSAGLDLLETGSTPSRQLRVWYWNGEDPYEEIERRVAAVISFMTSPIANKQLDRQV